jgi:general secretion pathway protein G
MNAATQPGRPMPIRWAVLALALGGTLFMLLRDVGLLAFVNGSLPYRYVARCDRTPIDIAIICTAIDTYTIEHGGRLPASLQDLVTPDEHGHTYLKDLTSIPPDRWGNPYVYEPQPDATYRVISYGEDGQPGGEGLSADIENVGMREGRSR